MVRESALVSPDSCLSIGGTVENPTPEAAPGWIQKSVFYPVLALVLGFSFVFYTARYQDQRKRGQESKQEGLRNT